MNAIIINIIRGLNVNGASIHSRRTSSLAVRAICISGGQMKSLQWMQAAQRVRIGCQGDKKRNRSMIPPPPLFAKETTTTISGGVAGGCRPLNEQPIIKYHSPTLSSISLSVRRSRCYSVAGDGASKGHHHCERSMLASQMRMTQAINR